jgi:hypothetical protein
MKSLEELRREKLDATAAQTQLDTKIELIGTFMKMFQSHSSAEIREAAAQALDELRQKYNGTARGTYFDQLHAFFTGARYNPEALHADMVKMLTQLQMPS